MHLINRQSMSLKKYSELKKLEQSKKRGYLYVYNAQSVDKIQNQLRELLKKWYKSMLSYVEDLDSLIECYEYGGELCS
jgi:predicted transcriptional regulator